MLRYHIFDISKGIDLNKTSISKELLFNTISIF